MGLVIASLVASAWYAAACSVDDSIEGALTHTETVAASSAQMDMFTPALQAVDRSSLGLQAIPTTGTVFIRRGQGRVPDRHGVHAVLIFDRGPFRKEVMLRESGGSFRVVFEHDEYQGPNKWHSPDGTFREEIWIDYEPSADGPFGYTGVHVLYWGDDATLQHCFTVAEIRPVLDEWKRLNPPAP
jgi:hypothetical protein